MSMVDENFAVALPAGNWPDRLRRNAASRYLYEKHGVQTAAQTLAKLAVSGGGPEYDLWGRIPYYSIEKLDGVGTVAPETAPLHV